MRTSEPGAARRIEGSGLNRPVEAGCGGFFRYGYFLARVLQWDRAISPAWEGQTNFVWSARDGKH